jgi:hypothetical protein
MNRRNILKNIGSGIVGSAAITTVTGEKQHDRSEVPLGDIIRSEQFQALIAELNPAGKTVGDSEAKLRSLGVRPSDVVSEVVTLDNETAVRRTTIPSRFGEFTAVSIGEHILDTVLLELEDDIPRGHRKRIDGIEAVGWASEAEAYLLGSTDGVTFLREVSDSERRSIEQAIDGRVSQATAFAGPDRAGYSVEATGASGASDDIDSSVEATESRENADEIGYALDREYELIETFDPSDTPDGQLVAQGCDLRITYCLSVLFPLPSPCIGCALVCSGGQAVPAVGQAACLTCLLATCGAVVLLYGACAGVQDCV